MKAYIEQYTARYHEMGNDHRMRVQCLCNYLEEAAGYHAAALGIGMEKLDSEGLAWVLAKMRICISRRPGPGESFTVETWPVRIERLQFRRDFLVYDSHKKPIASAVTQWVVMGLASRRLERFPPQITGLQPENPPLAQDSGDIKIPAVPEDATRGPCFPVRLADIDQNQHVNNGRYVDFALEAAYVAGMRGELAQLDVIFRAEGLRGDVICSSTTAEAGNANSLVHSLFRESSGQELARARSVWK